MINQPLLDFIKQQLSKGLTKEKITSDLLANGWDTEDVNEGFAAIVPKVSPVPAPTPNSNPTPVSAPTAAPVAAPISTPISNVAPSINNPVSPTVNLSMGSFIPPSYHEISSSIAPVQAKIQVKTKSHTGRNIFLTILVLFVLAGGASAYYFRDKIVNLPIVKSILAKY
jgi:hypothetical protein